MTKKYEAKQDFVTFLSPGTFVSESTTKEIGSWDAPKAVEMAKAIKERHGATPYGFQFSTRARKPGELDSKVIVVSGIFYLGGTVLTAAEIKARKDPEDRILIANMDINGWDRVVVNTNSWKVTMPLCGGDVVLPVDMSV